MKTFKAMLDRTNMDTLHALKKYPRKKKKRESESQHASTQRNFEELQTSYFPCV